MRNNVRREISTEAVKHLLHLKDDVEILHVADKLRASFGGEPMGRQNSQYPTNSIEIILSSEDLPEVAEGGIIPRYILDDSRIHKRPDWD